MIKITSVASHAHMYTVMPTKFGRDHKLLLGHYHTEYSEEKLFVFY